MDTTRGALGHWLKIKDKKISFYQIITPSTWDFSTRDDNGYRGVAEEALIGTPIQIQINLLRLAEFYVPLIRVCHVRHMYTVQENK